MSQSIIKITLKIWLNWKSNNLINLKVPKKTKKRKHNDNNNDNNNNNNDNNNNDNNNDNGNDNYNNNKRIFKQDKPISTWKYRYYKGPIRFYI